MSRLASQPRNVRYGIPRRMRAQHQTNDSSRPEIEPWHEQQASKTTKAGPRGGISKRIIQEISIKFKLNLNLN